MSYDTCIPKDKFDLEALARAKMLGFPELDPAIPALLEWLQDMNWPVANDVANLLAGAGPAIVPHIRFVLSSDDAVWKYWVLSTLLPKLDPSISTDLIPDIARLANRPTEDDKREDVDVVARGLMKGA
ncbi:DUF5071 domain-containing protein [Halovulum sp. GXIMD14793]